MPGVELGATQEVSANRIYENVARKSALPGDKLERVDHTVALGSHLFESVAEDVREILVGSKTDADHSHVQYSVKPFGKIFKLEGPGSEEEDCEFDDFLGNGSLDEGVVHVGQNICTISGSSNHGQDIVEKSDQERCQYTAGKGNSYSYERFLFVPVG